MSNQNNLKAFIEVTLLAGVLFVVPLGYYYGREHILNVQNRMYYRLFGIKEGHLEEYKRRQEEIKKRDEELVRKL
jgi:hypothetical protein